MAINNSNWSFNKDLVMFKNKNKHVWLRRTDGRNVTVSQNNRHHQSNTGLS